MKKKILLIILVVSVLLTGCKDKTKEEETDSQKFSKEYTDVSEYNVFVYKDIDEIIKILEHGTGIVYLGFPECPWCQAYVPKLNEVADVEGLEKVYYYNIYNDRKENTEKYQKIVSILSDHLQYDEEGNKHIKRMREELSVAFQHEMDHLDGILFVDRIDKNNPYKNKNLMREI